MIAAQCIAYTIYYTVKMFLKYEFKSRLLTCGTLLQLFYFYFSYFLSPTINTTHYNFITDNNNLQYTYPRHTRTLKHSKIFSKSRYLSVQNTFSCRIEVCRAQTFQLNYYNKLLFLQHLLYHDIASLGQLYVPTTYAIIQFYHYLLHIEPSQNE